MVLAVVCVALGVSLLVWANSRSSQLNQAERASDLVAATQNIRAALAQADAESVTAYLAGSAAPPELKTSYDEAIDTAAVELQRAAEAADSDDAKLAVGELQKLLPDYTGLIEAARANNRQGLPLGSGYLRSASELLRTKVAAQLDALRAAGDSSFRSVQGDLRSGLGIVPISLIVVVVAAFVLAQRWLSQRTRRTLNIGVVAATALLTLGLIWVSNSVGTSAQAAADATRDGYDRLSALSLVRADAYDQKARSTFTLVDRGAREVENAAAATAANNTDARLAALDGGRDDLLLDWQRYVELSNSVTERHNGGDYAGARRAVIAPSSDPESLLSRFTEFDESVKARIAAASTSFKSNLLDARQPVDRIRIIGLVVGILAAAAAAWGVQQRINDYR